MANKSILIAVGAAFTFATGAIAQEECTEYERKMFEMVDRAQVFWKSESFQEYGWSKNGPGPARAWFEDYQATKGTPQNGPDLEHFAFFEDYEFSIDDVYFVANEYRTEGYLDSFYQDTEDKILNAVRCN